MSLPLLTYAQGNTIIVLKALGQENIDDLLKLSEDYRKSESAPRQPPMTQQG